MYSIFKMSDDNLPPTCRERIAIAMTIIKTTTAIRLKIIPNFAFFALIYKACL